MEDNLVLDWQAENVAIREGEGSYFVEYYAQDYETGGWDCVREEEYRTIYDALKSILASIDAENEYQRKLDEASKGY